MGKRFGPHPDMSWSNSRDETFNYCSRQYYLHYYHSWRGWSTDDPAISESQRAAFRLKKLTSLHSVLGDVVHKLCEARIAAIRDGAAWLGVDQVRERIRDTLNEAYRTSRDRAAFFRRPNRPEKMLHCYYYGGRLDPHEVEAVRSKMEACIRHLVTHPIWSELESLPREAFLAIEQRASFPVDGVPVWVKADLIYRVEDEVTVLDWKTRSDDDYPARPVLALYALYARDVLAVPWAEGKWRGRVVNLVTGDSREYPLSQADLVRAESRIRVSVAEMRQVLEDEAANKPMPIEHFPLANPVLRARCPYCSFFELCAPELSQVRRGEDEARTGSLSSLDRREQESVPRVAR